MKEIIDSPVFGVLLSILTFEIGLFVNKKSRIGLLNPLAISIVLIIAVLSKFHISLESFNKGGDMITFFLGPATVVLAVPLYKHIKLLKENAAAIIAGITIGCITALSSTWLISRLFGLKGAMLASMIPKSITTPIGMEISKQIGGIPAISIAAIVLTGITGSIIGPWLCGVTGIKDRIALGISLGTSSHAIGTSKAIEIGETEGGMSGLAMGVAGLMTVILAPIFMKLVQG